MSEARKSELFARLHKCSRGWNQEDLVPDHQKRECRRIGEALNGIGGMDLMQEAYYHAKGENPNVHVIQAFWDGIGDWRW